MSAKAWIFMVAVTAFSAIDMSALAETPTQRVLAETPTQRVLRESKEQQEEQAKQRGVPLPRAAAPPSVSIQERERTGGERALRGLDRAIEEKAIRNLGRDLRNPS